MIELENIAANMSNTLKSAIITGVFVLAAAVIGAVIGIYPSIRAHKNDVGELAVAGIVVDRDTDQGIGQAAITVAGRTEQYVTEDSGNFRFNVFNNPVRSLRLHVTKAGFRPLDISVEAPAENLVLQLNKQ
jgi:hypothetical protein